jgi:hypothetical protein
MVRMAIHPHPFMNHRPFGMHQTHPHPFMHHHPFGMHQNHPHPFMHHRPFGMHQTPHHHIHHMYHNSSNPNNPNNSGFVGQQPMSYAPQYPVDQTSSSTTTTTAASAPLRTFPRDLHRNVPELHNLKIGMVGPGAVQLNTALEKCNTLQASQLRRPDMDMIEEATFEALEKIRPGCNEAMLANKQLANCVRDLVSVYISNGERYETPEVRHRGRRGRRDPRHPRHRMGNQNRMFGGLQASVNTQAAATPDSPKLTARSEERSSTAKLPDGKLYPDVDAVPSSISSVAGSDSVPSSSSTNASFDVPPKFQRQVSQLVEMGFFDIKQLVDALEKHNGNFELTLAELLS